ncbi:SDR family NAD(P)-dependent oxidoreductase [Gordonia amarae]|uniref:SDR family NAD(P)-dependent oxidoreductase n=2 Tax=Gordonia amarae TaxID=36821 RepID=A0A857MCU1_9ACTN|nr:SDR family NAD(P)-dependent oxidoreductase [Gordonia amarae]MCS3878834.1 NAD(P)-dependent dehydrogenase (short-subunit alcohol dehydrogenase family) [Gordonia amarae]QHN17400.1 SDR family NAD(P)-dependent oxidoreductase [Gordonia amarae]QHN21926.1 SDR family NAD(P)-dependent oxidoreductase [Gordonia amarae]QHN30806.1 SDR family NAD(P)-dependent oxidoreductase [Gordonia amarae]QHN39552.1 SDR family NAD(P)-dependent oxidoreductase [Gordonia amarae]
MAGREPQTIIITGAGDGIGAAAAKQLAERGERVVVVGRSAAKTAAVADKIGAPHHLADFAELAQVRALADELLEAYPKIDVLANNAGGIFRRESTVDGFDKTLQVNHLAPFLLTNLLLDRLADAGGAKVIATSSIGARLFGHLDVDDLNNERRWSANKSYGDAKLANILFTRELHRRYHDRGIAAVSFHPGNVATAFANDTSSVLALVFGNPLTRLSLDSPAKAGGKLVWLAEGTPGQTWKSGEFYDNNKVSPRWKMNRQSFDDNLAARLWERSAVMTGVGG